MGDDRRTMYGHDKQSGGMMAETPKVLLAASGFNFIADLPLDEKVEALNYLRQALHESGRRVAKQHGCGADNAKLKLRCMEAMGRTVTLTT